MQCTACGASYDSETYTCDACGHAVTVVDGYPAFAPELAHGGGGYESKLFAELAPLEERSFWFRARNELILWALRRYRPDVSSFLEIGCGTGFVLSGIAAQHPTARLYGSEIFVDGLSFAGERVPSARLMQMDARAIPMREEIDVIGAFDVLEHIEEDVDVLREMHGALKQDGLLVISVPQHRWLWSPADDHAHHVRRYTAGELRDKVSGAGFEVLKSTSFVSILLPMMMLSRLRMRGRTDDYDPIDEMRMPGWLNAVLYRVMRAENALIRWGLRFPLGGSRLVVARKVTQGDDEPPG
jgi:SAM-dependent methyltransferase